SGEINAVVYDTYGREAMRWNDQIYNNGFQLQGFTLEELPKGIYFVRLTTPDRDKTYRVIKG
ncbi:T9SS type A sorting domain-containing protein, partial [bacterium]|nr:T9SS type A sorting domain-containing protein [bacterium]